MTRAGLGPGSPGAPAAVVGAGSSAGTARTMSAPPSAPGPASRPVAPVPLRRCLVPLLVALVPWLVVVLGRGLCLVAQRIPPLVRLVRLARRWLESRRAEEQFASSLAGARPLADR